MRVQMVMIQVSKKKISLCLADIDKFFSSGPYLTVMLLVNEFHYVVRLSAYM